MGNAVAAPAIAAPVMAQARADPERIEELRLLLDEVLIAHAVCEPLASDEMVAMSADRVTVEAKPGCNGIQASSRVAIALPQVSDVTEVAVEVMRASGYLCAGVLFGDPGVPSASGALSPNVDVVHVADGKRWGKPGHRIEWSSGELRDLTSVRLLGIVLDLTRPGAGRMYLRLDGNIVGPVCDNLPAGAVVRPVMFLSDYKAAGMGDIVKILGVRRAAAPVPRALPPPAAAPAAAAAGAPPGGGGGVCARSRACAGAVCCVHGSAQPRAQSPPPPSPLPRPRPRLSVCRTRCSDC